MTGYSRRTFELVAWLEGLSFLLLLCVAMPLKYLAGVPAATSIVGLLHGLAFLAYVVVVIDLYSTERWPARSLATALVAAVVPAGTFLFVRKVRTTDASGH